MVRKKREFSVRFFTADGVEVGSLLDLAGSQKDELVEQIIAALARDAARRDHLAEIGRQPNDQHRQSKLPADGIKTADVAKDAQLLVSKKVKVPRIAISSLA